MARPRKPYGNPPGRLPATMLKVLAAELSDSARLGRGKHLWAEDAVVDIVIGHGAVTAEVQGSRPAPYVVTIETEPGSGTPSRRELWVQCTCPDDAGTGTDACKHVVATLFALSDEIAIEPELLERWRGGRARARDRAEPAPAVEPGGRHLRLVPSLSGPDREREPAPEPAERFVPDPATAQIGALLTPPGGALPPAFAPVTPLSHPLPPGEVWAQVLTDALDELDIPWE
jgi:hypothetical protein